MARTLNINITDISFCPYGLTSPLSYEYPAFDRFDSRTDFALSSSMTHLAVAFRTSNLNASSGNLRKSRQTFWVNIVDHDSERTITSRTTFVEMQPWENDGIHRVDIPLRPSQLAANRYYHIEITVPGINDGTPLVSKEFRLVKVPGLEPRGFYTPHWSTLMDNAVSYDDFTDTVTTPTRYISKLMPHMEIDATGKDTYPQLYVTFLLTRNIGAWDSMPEIMITLVGETGNRITERANLITANDLYYKFLEAEEILVQMPVSRELELGGYFYAEISTLGCPIAGSVFDVYPLNDPVPGELINDDIRFIPGYTDSMGVDILIERNNELELKQQVLSAEKEKKDETTRLDSLIGLDSVKAKVVSYRRLIEFNSMREKAGLRSSNPPLHCLFLGSPGTGKTTVAKIMGEILRECGVLSKGHVVMRERSTLLGKYYSSEGENVNQALEEARGGILFIDEAYQLNQPDDPKDPGRFVLESLMTALADESNRDWMLILAGYTEPMMGLFELNPGLKSRIPESNHYIFEDFSENQLLEIAEGYLRERDFHLSAGARETLSSRLHADYMTRGKDFGNARHVINLIETDIFPAMATRVSSLNAPTIEQLSRIEQSDIPMSAPARKALTSPRPSIGFKLRS